MALETKPVLQFGPFQLDPVERLLLRDGSEVRLSPKAFDVLVALVRSQGHLLEKDDLLKQVWPGTFVEESSLAQQVSLLRKALQDGEDGISYIETVPKSGYRFTAPVQEVSRNGSANVAETPPAALQDASPVSARPGASRFWIALVAMVAILLVAAAVIRQRNRRQNPPLGKVMIVVLPFQNLTGDPGQDFLSDGFTEEMITQLGRLDPAHLGVIARTSAMHYRDTNLGVDTIARELGVQYVVEGSVRGAGNQIRISAQLIAVRDQTHLWAETYERGTRDVLGVETEVAQAIARAVRIKLSPQREAQLSRRATSPDAYELYLKGRYYWNKRTEAGLKQGAEYFQEAIALDGDSAEAYAGLSDCYALLSFYGGRSVQQSFPLAKRAALQAIARDDSSAEAHTSLGFVLFWYDWDWPSAEREYRRALEINPGYATARQYYAEYLRLMGHQEEAILEGKRAIELDPLSPVIQMQLAMPYYYQGRNDEAIRQLQILLQREPDFAAGRAHLGWIYEQAGRYDDAIREYETATAHEDFTWALGGLGRAYARKGDAAKAKELIRLLDTKFGASASYGIALIYAGLGDKDRALQYLDRAYQDHYWGMLTLKVEPKWNDLRSDPRFVSLVHKIGLSRSF